MNNQPTVYWRMGVRHPKNWNHWSWSPEFPSFEAMINAYSAWLRFNPRRVVTFASRQATLAPTTQNKGAQQ